MSRALFVCLLLAAIVLAALIKPLMIILLFVAMGVAISKPGR